MVPSSEPTLVPMLQFNGAEFILSPNDEQAAAVSGVVESRAPICTPADEATNRFAADNAFANAEHLTKVDTQEPQVVESGLVDEREGETTVKMVAEYNVGGVNVEGMGVASATGIRTVPGVVQVDVDNAGSSVMEIKVPQPKTTSIRSLSYDADGASRLDSDEYSQKVTVADSHYKPPVAYFLSQVEAHTTTAFADPPSQRTLETARNADAAVETALAHDTTKLVEESVRESSINATAMDTPARDLAAHIEESAFGDSIPSARAQDQPALSPASIVGAVAPTARPQHQAAAKPLSQIEEENACAVDAATLEARAQDVSATAEWQAEKIEQEKDQLEEEEEDQLEEEEEEDQLEEQEGDQLEEENTSAVCAGELAAGAQDQAALNEERESASAVGVLAMSALDQAASKRVSPFEEENASAVGAAVVAATDQGLRESSPQLMDFSTGQPMDFSTLQPVPPSWVIRWIKSERRPFKIMDGVLLPAPRYSKSARKNTMELDAIEENVPGVRQTRSKDLDQDRTPARHGQPSKARVEVRVKRRYQPIPKRMPKAKSPCDLCAAKGIECRSEPGGSCWNCRKNAKKACSFKKVGGY